MPVFTANVPGILKVGDKIEIGGKIKENARKMSVNLCAQEGEEPRDVVLHFDVRFHRDNIISLSRKNGIWIGSGNYDTNYNMFVPGTIFRIVFEIKDTDVITIYCQGKFHSNFLPKIPLSMAKFIVAWADVERITHCYFHIGNKALGDEPGPVPSYGPGSPRLNGAPNVGGDGKQRWPTTDDRDPMRHTVPVAPHSLKFSPRMHKKHAQGVPESPQMGHSSNESSDEDAKIRAKESRADRDRFFFETMMCPQTDPTFPTGRRPDTVRVRQEYKRKYIPREMTETEKIDSEDDSEDLTKNSSIADTEDIIPEMKRRHRRKFTPFAQVVSFMGKNGRRN